MPSNAIFQRQILFIAFKWPFLLFCLREKPRFSTKKVLYNINLVERGLSIARFPVVVDLNLGRAETVGHDVEPEAQDHLFVDV